MSARGSAGRAPKRPRSQERRAAYEAAAEREHLDLRAWALDIAAEKST